MVDSPEELDRLADNLKAELSRPETLGRLFGEVAPDLSPGGRNLVYVLAQVERIGHLAMEQFFLKTLYMGEYDRIIVVTGPTDQPGVNPAVLEVPGPEFVHVETRDPLVPYLGFFDGGLMQTDMLDLLLATPQHLARDFGRAVTSGVPLRHFELPRDLRARGDAWMTAAGIDPAEPFVLLHVRDASYRPDKAHHLFRCADIRRYGPAIDRLVEAGYRVFRLGDSAGPPLPHPSGKVVDLPHLGDYAPFLDVYLAARCAFAVNQASGPEALVRAFGKPALTVNLVLEHLRLPLPGDRLVFKHFKRVDGSELSYPELLEAGIATFGASEQFEAAGISVEDNTEAELEAAVVEMLESYAPDAVLQERFLVLGRDYEARIMDDAAVIERREDFYAYAHPFGEISASFAAINPGFLG